MSNNWSFCDPLDPETLRRFKYFLSDGCIDPAPDPSDTRITQVTIQTLGDMTRVVELWLMGCCQYRGQANDHPLLPQLTRPGEPCLKAEKDILERFRAKAKNRIRPPDGVDRLNELELAMLAQHHYEPTRLLDWTLNPNAALHFAVDGECRGDYSVVWAVPGHRYSKNDIATTSDIANPFKGLDHPNPEYKGRAFFVFADESIPRAIVQGSLFAIWSNPDKSFLEVEGDNAKVWKIKIPRERRDSIRWALYCHGMTNSTLLPDDLAKGRSASEAWKQLAGWDEIYRTAHIPKPR